MSQIAQSDSHVGTTQQNRFFVFFLVATPHCINNPLLNHSIPIFSAVYESFVLPIINLLNLQIGRWFGRKTQVD